MKISRLSSVSCDGMIKVKSLMFKTSLFPHDRRRRPNGRGGFTMIEMLVVILVIGILAAILLPAIGSVMTRARDAQVMTEIKALETGLAGFKSTYGVDPPSRITICEDQADWTAADRATIRRMWPQFSFATQDRNGDGDDTDSITLSPSESLVFFLGGTLSGATAPVTCLGFSKNPANPGLAGGSRDGPFFEFAPSRLRLTTRGGFTVATYLDPLPDQTHPYLYFSSYEGQGYRTPSSPAAATDELPIDPTTGLYSTTGTFSDVYRLSAGGPAHKAQSFQIISPGADGLYGSGGPFDPNDGVTSLANGRPTATTDPNYAGRAEYDNLTSFHTSGRLKP